MHLLAGARSRPALALLASGALVAVAPATALAQDDPPSLTGDVIELVVDRGEGTTVDLGPNGRSPGDLYAFRSIVEDTAGNEVGAILGTQTSVGFGDDVSAVQGLATFELPEGQIVIGGRSGLRNDENGLIPGRHQRPILGGTGVYAGVSGQVVTRALGGNRYRQRLELVRPRAGKHTIVRTRGGSQETLTIDLPPADQALGDLRVFAGKLAKPKGLVRGTQTVVHQADGTEIASGAITFSLPGGQLAVSGLSGTPVGGGGLIPGRSVERAVVGGSGRYAGMAGTVTTTFRQDSYRARFDLFPARKRAGTVRLTALKGPQRSVDIGNQGTSPGDLTVFAAPLASKDGNPAGVAIGSQTSIREEQGGLTVNGLLTYQLRRGDLVVGGLSSYPLGGKTGLKKGQFFERPILGGTGAYAGMRGELRSVRRADGTYAQVFKLRAAG